MSAPVSITAPCPAKMLLPAAGATKRASHAVGAIDGDGRVERVDRRHDVDRRVERAVEVVSSAAPDVSERRRHLLAGGQVDLGQAEPREAGDDARRHPLAGRVDHLRSGRQLHPDIAGRDDPAVADDHRPLGIGCDPSPSATVPPLMAKVCALTPARRAAEQQGRCETADHFTSPSPGWPSSKSLTGRRLGSLASYISAPSIHTRSGRV